MGTHCETDTLLRVCRMFDIDIWGEGEIPLWTLCLQLQQDDPALESAPNAVLYPQNLIWSTNVPAAEPVDLNQEAIPNCDNYFVQAKGHVALETTDLPIENSRGCYWNRCKFCSLTESYIYRLKEVGKLLNELRLLQVRCGVSMFTFVVEVP